MRKCVNKRRHYIEKWGVFKILFPVPINVLKQNPVHIWFALVEWISVNKRRKCHLIFRRTLRTLHAFVHQFRRWCRTIRPSPNIPSAWIICQTGSLISSSYFQLLNAQTSAPKAIYQTLRHPIPWLHEGRGTRWCWEKYDRRLKLLIGGTAEETCFGPNAELIRAAGNVSRGERVPVNEFPKRSNDAVNRAFAGNCCD